MVLINIHVYEFIYTSFRKLLNSIYYKFLNKLTTISITRFPPLAEPFVYRIIQNFSFCIFEFRNSFINILKKLSKNTILPALL